MVLGPATCATPNRLSLLPLLLLPHPAPPHLEGEGSLFIKVTLGEGAGAFPQHRRPGPALQPSSPMELIFSRRGRMRGSSGGRAGASVPSTASEIRREAWRLKRGEDLCDQSYNQGDFGVKMSPGSPTWPASASFPQFRGLPGFLSENLSELPRPPPPSPEGPEWCFCTCWAIWNRGDLRQEPEDRGRRESGAARPWKSLPGRRALGMAQKGLDLHGRRVDGPEGGTSVSKGRGAGMPNRGRMVGGPNTWWRAGPKQLDSQQAWVGKPRAALCHQVSFSHSLLGRDWGSQGNSRQAGALTCPCSGASQLRPTEQKKWV